MGSYKGIGRNQGPNRRRNDKAQRRRGFLRFESLEDRTLLAQSASNPLATVQSGPMAKEGQQLTEVYQASQQAGYNPSALPAEFSLLQFQGSSVNISVQGSGDINAFAAALKNLGMQVTATDAPYGLVEGYAPIAQLPAIAALPQTLNANPNYKQFLQQANYQGVADNEAQTSTFADVARSQFNVTGAGVTVGVISDSVSQFAGGLADSYNTGDLSAANPVKVLQDLPAGQGGTDEGRAMLENIHDIAPGASLQFSTGFVGGEPGFASAITGLANAGSNVIVDDLGDPNEPYFQDGLVTQAIDQVVAQGHTYFSAAGNQDFQGYLSNFRPVAATVGSLGQGTYMNFDPGSGITTQLPIIVGNAVSAPVSAQNPVDIFMQFDQPWSTQETGATKPGPTSEVDLYVLDSSGNVVASSTNNNVMTGQTDQEVQIPAPGSYTLVMKVVQGTAPAHVELINYNENAPVAISQQFGSAGGTYYPSSGGHETAAATIGVGAVPWWAPAPYLGQNPLFNEPFSSFGPGLKDISPSGATTAPQIVMNPTISAPDLGNTSFFIPGQIINTTQPIFPTVPATAITPAIPGNPTTTTNLAQNLPTFSGTSSAAPNAAAVAALMLQKVPSLTPAQIRSTLIASAVNTPLDGAAKGAWSPQGGYGLINAVTALSAADVLRVVATNPANGATVTTAPGGITFTFNKPVVFSTVTAADLKITAPAGVTATVGAPIAVDNPIFPTVITFPFTLTRTNPNILANGSYSYTLASPAGGPIVTSEDGKQLAAQTGTFTLNDITDPRIVNTAFNGRIVTVTFNKAMNPATINPQDLFLVYQPPNGAPAVNLNLNPGSKLSYNPTTDTATLDYSALPQAQMPNGQYYLVVLGNPGPDVVPGTTTPGFAVTDVVGNPLDGEFYTEIDPTTGQVLRQAGVFPSGEGDVQLSANGTPVTNPTTGNPVKQRSTDENFVQPVGPVTLAAPVITSIQLQPASDTGIAGDQNTNNARPTFIGQVSANFPGTVAGLTVYIEFNGLHGGALDLATGGGSPARGFTGNYDVTATTDANGTFTFQAPAFLPEGYNTLRAVVVGQPDSPPLPGLSSSLDSTFRIDLTSPQIVAATIPGVPGPLAFAGTNIPTLTSLSLDVIDPNNPPTGPFATPTSILYPALDPSTADNTSNYTLINTTTGKDYSSYIASATFVATAPDFTTVPPVRNATSDPNAGRIDLTFQAGLPQGTYLLFAHTSETVNGVTYPGLRDAAGNALKEPFIPGQPDYLITFNINPQPVYITNVSTNVPNAQGVAQPGILGGMMLPRSYYEINPRAGDLVSAPPTTFYVDFSTPLATTDPQGNPINFNDALMLVRSADTANSQPDGDFGNLGVAGITPLSPSASGFTRVDPAGTTVTLGTGPNGSNTRLTLQLPAGTVLPADHYRFYIPNQAGTDALYDIFGNRLDGEFLGNPTAAYSTVPIPGSPPGTGPYEDFMPDGTYRNGMSGDGVAGGAFMTGFTVVPSGNVVYAQASYVENPLQPSTLSDGSITKPYPVLAPQATATPANGGNLNATSNFFAFNPTYDRAGSGHFDQSAIYAAQVLSANGPVVIVALPSTPQFNPVPGVSTTPSFVLQAPAGADPVANDGSASVPFDTTLVFDAGTILKLQNASLFAQNQGSAIQTLGDSNQPVYLTSYKNDAIGGDTNHDASNTTPNGGDWGGIVFRNFDEQATSTLTTGGGFGVPPTTTTISRLNNPNFPAFPVDGVLQGPNGTPAISGEDDALSFLNFASISYGGGAVPATQGFRYDSITSFASRPFIANTLINGGGSAASQAAISGDLDSFREDDTARGMLVRRTQVMNASINGIWIRPDTTGVAESTDAIPSAGPVGGGFGGGAGNTTIPGAIPDNPVTMGGVRNYTLDSPLPYVLTSLLNIGQRLQLGSGGNTNSVQSRLYIQPGMMIKSERGAGIQVVTPGASINIGDRTYISGYDAQASIDPTTGLPTSTYGPLNPDGTPNPNFKPETTGDARVIFTSALDNAATTYYTDPVTQVKRTIVPAIDVLNTGGANQPVIGQAVALSQRWGSITINSGAEAVIDEADFDFGGGELNINGGTTQRNALTLNGSQGRTTSSTSTTIDPVTGLPVTTTTFTLTPGMGARVMVTNDNFFSNADTPMAIDPNGLLATNPLTPLTSGNPYFRGNVMQYNGINGLGVQNGFGGGLNQVNLTNNSVWDDTDVVYILRGTIVPENDPNVFGFGVGTGGTGQPPPPTPGPAAGSPVPTPWVTLTIESQLPGTPLADGSSIAKPGESVIVKALGRGPGAADLGSTDSYNAGAGFAFGVDNGIDPPTDPLIDQGANSQLRILGIGSNQTTGQQRVPAILTSVNDNTVGRTIRGVSMFSAIDGNTTAPAGGDAGIIYFGSLSLTTFNAFNVAEGNKIDNADIHYFTRIEFQGGGVANPKETFSDQKELTISNSNLSNFLDDAVLTHPGFNYISGIRSTNRGEATELFMVNDTIYNNPTGVRIDGDNSSGAFPVPEEFVALNNTFYGNGNAVDIEGIYALSAADPAGHVHFIAMDNIFSNNSTTGVLANGRVEGSIMEYNLFFSNGADTNLGGSTGIPNYGAVSGDPRFRNAAAGNFQLYNRLTDPQHIGSAAIDAARSELTLINVLPNGSEVGDSQGALVGTLVPLEDPATGLINSNTRTPDGVQTNLPEVLTLPGFPERGFADEFSPILPANPTSPTFTYTAITGQRDQLGYQRIDDPATPNVGFGSNPFYDIGAFEYVPLNPPHVTGVTAIVTDPTAPGGIRVINLYNVGSYAGTNLPIQSILVQFDHNIDQNTINGQSVTLEQSGGTGVFGNPGNPNDRFINLSGKLSFNPTANVLTISVGGSGLTLGSDEYRLTLHGNGSAVLRDPQGNALDGENTLSDNPNNPQLALPSGDGFPGGDFFDTFVVNTVAPTIALTPTGASTFNLDPGSDTNFVGDNITNNNRPSFSGTINVSQPAIDPLLGQTVFIDVSNNNGATWTQVGSGTTDAAGHFLVQATTPLPDSNYKVGPSGLLNSPLNAPLNKPLTGTTGQTLARVRIVDQSGNQSNPNDPHAHTSFIVDTAPPVVTSFSPAAGSVNTPVATGGKITVTFTTNKNLDPATVNGSSILIVGAGPDGIFGTTDDVTVPIDAGSLVITPILPASRLGAEQVSFTISQGLSNGQYMVTLKGTGTTPMLDIAGNALAGTNSQAGTDFSQVFTVFNPTVGKTIFVGPASGATPPTGTQGTRANPYPTIQAAINAASAGDTVAVLPGIYNENVTLKAEVRVLSVGMASTDANLINPGSGANALTTIIRAPVATPPAAGQTATTTSIAVSAVNLGNIGGGGFNAVPGLDTEIAGFTITAPLLGDPVRGTVDPSSIGLLMFNSNVLVENNYFIDTHFGIYAGMAGVNLANPRIADNVFAGNDSGIWVDATASGISVDNAHEVQVINNDFAYNTFAGLYANITNPNPSPAPLVNAANNIFFQNHSLGIPTFGTGAGESLPGSAIVLRNNLFSGNGASQTSPVDDAINIVAGGFNAAALNGLPSNPLGNFVGNPAFVMPVDPRPNSQGPTTFFNLANYNLTASSAAIDSAIDAYAPTLDFLNLNHHVATYFPGTPFFGHHFFGITGPADVGAFEYQTGTAAATVRAASVSALDVVANPVTASTPAPAVIPTPAPVQALAVASAPAPAVSSSPAPAPVTISIPQRTVRIPIRKAAVRKLVVPPHVVPRRHH